LQFEIEHQSPQVLVIKNGTCVYHATHQAIEAAIVQAAL
jgi:bacillithiol system protein YtxJ